MMSFDFDTDLIARLRRNIVEFRPQSIDPGTLIHAAVAVTVIPDGDAGAFLLTRRATTLSAHSGQWALPGGRVDEGETAIEAALRELREEVGLELPAARVLGRLDDYPTRSGYRITPIVVWAEAGQELVPDPAEVASIHHITLAALADPETPEFGEIPESDRPLIRLNIADSQIHAPTAAVLYQFREVALFGRHTRVDHLEQPGWAWR